MELNHARKNTLKKEKGSKYDTQKYLGGGGTNLSLRVKRMQRKEMHTQKLERIQIIKIKV